MDYLLAEVNKVDEDLEVSRDGRKQASDWVQVSRGGGGGWSRRGGGGGKGSLRGERQHQSVKQQMLGYMWPVGPRGYIKGLCLRPIHSVFRNATS